MVANDDDDDDCDFSVSEELVETKLSLMKQNEYRIDVCAAEMF